MKSYHHCDTTRRGTSWGYPQTSWTCLTNTIRVDEVPYYYKRNPVLELHKDHLKWWLFSFSCNKLSLISYFNSQLTEIYCFKKHLRYSGLKTVNINMWQLWIRLFLADWVKIYLSKRSMSQTAVINNTPVTNYCLKNYWRVWSKCFWQCRRTVRI